MIYAAVKNDPSEAPRQQFIDVNDLPDWQPLNPIAKNSNRELKKMYKGKAWND